jgi:type I restriction enzyme S subunit
MKEAIEQEADRSRDRYRQVQLGPKEFEVPKDWRYVDFNDVIEVNPSYDKPESDLFDFVPMDAVSEEEQRITYVNERNKEDCTTTWFKNGDTIYPKITPCTENGKIAFVEGVETQLASGSTEFIVFHPREGETTPKFVYYLSNMPQFRAVTISLVESSTGRQRVPNDIFEDNLKISVPPLSEQSRIAAVLSVVDKELRQTEAIIETTEEFRIGLRQELFHQGYFDHETKTEGTFGEVPANWDIKRLDDVADVTMGSSPKSEYYNEDGDGLPFFQANNEFGYRNPTHDRWCSNPKKTAEEGDVLVTIRGTYVGQVNIATEKCCIGRGLAAVSATEVDQEYLFHQLDQREAYVKSIASGSTFDSINSSELRSLLVQVPLRNEQEKIAEALKSAQMKYIAEREKKQKLQELKRGLMQDLLTGQVRTPPDLLD